MMELLFIHIGISDIIDILLVAFLIYTVYKLVKGTVAINIFIGLVSIYFIWKIVGLLQMRMLNEILGQFISVGMIALIIVFQQEIRNFLLMLGKLSTNKNLTFKFLKPTQTKNITNLNAIFLAMENMSNSLTGALIVIRNSNELKTIIHTGENINGKLSAPLLESIFYKNSPLHDGAAIIYNDIIEAARCILPVSDKTNFPPEYGLRHRAAAGLTQHTDAICLIVSEQTGELAYSENGELITKLSIEELKTILTKKI